MQLFFGSFIFAIFTQLITAEVYSSLVGLEMLLETERELTRMVEQYIQNEKDRLERIKEYVQKKDMQFAPDITGLGTSLNPIDAYLFLKRVVTDSDSLYNLMHENSAESVLALMPQRLLFPDKDDLRGATSALLRLQDTYKLDTTDVADGRIQKFPKIQPLSSDDCFQVAYISFSSGDYYHALPWLLETEAKYLDEINSSRSMLQTFELPVIYDYLAYAMHARGNPDHAVWYSRNLRALAPNHPSAQYVEIYEDNMLNANSTWDGIHNNLPAIVNQRDMGGIFWDYEALCRGETYMSELERSRLFCYLKRDTDYLKLAPIKVEKVYQDPEAFIFRQVMSDDEIETLKQLAIPKLARAMVVNDQNKKSELGETPANVAASFRVAKNMWLEDGSHPLVDRISKRVRDFTNLDQETAEGLQIANYGLGGHYEPHFDMATDEQKASQLTEINGNRIATVLFYLSTPEAGGGTVFEPLRIGVQATKNDALFWHNLHKSGRPDLRTRHAACPVLYGTKWVANKWVHEKGQDTWRPCGLNENE